MATIRYSAEYLKSLFGTALAGIRCGMTCYRQDVKALTERYYKNLAVYFSECKCTYAAELSSAFVRAYLMDL